MGFVDKLRMNNIFPGTQINLGWTGELPQFGGRDPLKEIVNIHKRETRRAERRMDSASQPRIQQVAQRALSPKSAEPMSGGPTNVRFVDTGITDYQKATLDQRERQYMRQNEDRDLSRDLSAARVGIADYKARNPNKKFITVKGGNVMAFDPVTGEAEDTGIPSGSLSERDRIRIQQEHNVSMQEDRQTAAESLEKMRQAGRQSLQEDRQAYDTENDWGRAIQTYNPDGTPAGVVQINSKGETRAVKGMGSIVAPKVTSATQQGHAITNRMREVINRNPQWAQYIDIENQLVRPVGYGGSYLGGNQGLTAADREKILQAIYGTTPAATPTTPATPVTKEKPVSQNTAPSGMIKIKRLKDGKTGNYPANRALPPGYEVVK